MRAHWAVFVLASILILVSLGSVMTNVASALVVPNIGDFKCYKGVFTTGFPIFPDIDLTDQFGTTTHTGIDTREEICGTALMDPPGTPPPILDHHFQCYNIQGPSPLETVEVTDQFGTETYEVLDAKRVCLPTLAQNADIPIVFPIQVDVHWKCYGIDGPALGLTVDLTDQFVTSTHVIGKPIELCVPATKTLPDGTNFPPELDVYLKCYEINGPALSSVFGYQDQFTSTSQTITEPAKLCTSATRSIVSILIGGTYIPIDSTALILAGVQSISMWMIPVILAGIGVGVFVIKRRK